MEIVPEKVLIRDIGSKVIGKLIAVEGIVRKSTDVRPKLVVGAYECQCCGHINRIHQAGANRRGPSRCEGCDKPGPFNLLDQESEFVDYQEVTIQELVEDLQIGEQSRQLIVRLEDDLTGKLKFGDSVEFVGVLKVLVKKSGMSEPFLEADEYAIKARGVGVTFPEL